jgi:RNA 2',3'-cyclic 3'-phosphodiesterase
MRLFIAITLAPATIAALERELEAFKSVSGPLKWAAPQTIHLTLKFLGETSAHTCAALQAALAGPAYGIAPFELSLAGFGSFGRDGDISIFWAGVAPSEPLQRLFGQIEERATRAGFTRESRPFHPHVTLGRNKGRHDWEPMRRLLEEHSSRVIAAQTVAGFALYASALRPEGPRHDLVREFACA